MPGLFSLCEPAPESSGCPLEEVEESIRRRRPEIKAPQRTKEYQAALKAVGAAWLAELEREREARSYCPHCRGRLPHVALNVGLSHGIGGHHITPCRLNATRGRGRVLAQVGSCRAVRDNAVTTGALGALTLVVFFIVVGVHLGEGIP